MHRLRQQTVNRAFVDFFVDEPNADEDRDQRAKHQHGAQAKRCGELAFHIERQIAYEHRRRDKDQHKEDQVVEHAVADGLAECVERDGANSARAARFEAHPGSHHRFLDVDFT